MLRQALLSIQGNDFSYLQAIPSSLQNGIPRRPKKTGILAQQERKKKKKVSNIKAQGSMLSAALELQGATFLKYI